MTTMIASTTSTQEELDHAVSEDWRTPPVPKEPEIPEGEQPPPKTEGESETPNPPEDKGKGGWQKRIDKLTARAKAAEERADRIEKELRDLRAEKNPSATPAAEPKIDAAKPKQSDFQTTEAYVEALTKWTLAQERAAEAKRESDENLKATFDSYNEGISKIQEEADDFDEVMGNASIRIPTAVHMAIISMGSDGAAIAYALAKHPEECEKLMTTMAERGDAAAVLEMGRIAARLLPENPNPPQEKPPRQVPPPPIRRVEGASASQPMSLDDPRLSQKEYNRIRNQQEREARRH